MNNTNFSDTQDLTEKSLRQKKIINLLAIFNIATVLLMGMLLSNMSYFQAFLNYKPEQQSTGAPRDLHSTADLSDARLKCDSIELTSFPHSSLSENESAFLNIKVQPENFQGTFRFSTDGGILNDLNGNSGGIIFTSERKIAYIGGEAGSVITVQAEGEGNEKCTSTLTIVPKETIVCQQLNLNVYPSPLPANESAKIKIMVSPPTFNDKLLIYADSGKFQIVDPDFEASGNNSNIVVTKSRELFYSGGKAGEHISIRALGEKNLQCQTAIKIE